MAIRIEDEYTEAIAASSDYPEGSFKNVSSPGGTDGTPFEKEWPNDIQGFLQKVLQDAGITASGVADTAVLSQYLNGLKYIAGRNLYQNDIDYDVDMQCLGSDGILYKCLIANGPASSIVGPVGDLTSTWVELLNPIYSLSLSGYQFFPINAAGERLCVQWGITPPLGAAADSNVTLPIAFPAQALACVLTNANFSTATSGADSKTFRGFVGLNTIKIYNGSAFAGQYQYIAIGK